MPWYRMRSDEPGPLAGGMIHVKLDRRHAMPPCAFCGTISRYACDWKLARTSPDGRVATCDRPLCRHCTTRVTEIKDLCPRHVLAYQAWLAARTNSTDGEGP